MRTIDIAVMNRSTVLDDKDVRSVVPALQKQVTDDFAPAWGLDASLSFIEKGSHPEPGAWWLTVFDDSDQAGALGYHDVTPDGLPLGKVFAASDLKFGYEWTVTISHELLEMRLDPEINLTVFDQQTAAKGRLYAYEVCDACEADEYGYRIDGVLVSDFVYPAWFQSSRKPNSTKFDHMGRLSEPFELLSGGYIGVFDVSAGTGWTQLTPKKARLAYSARARVGSRRERRRTPREQWLHSEISEP